LGTWQEGKGKRNHVPSEKQKKGKERSVAFLVLLESRTKRVLLARFSATANDEIGRREGKKKGKRGERRKDRTSSSP